MRDMAKKQTKETQAEQSDRFRNDVRRMIDAGELNPTEADEAFERLVSTAASAKPRN
jgi:hypothetical protein